MLRVFGIELLKVFLTDDNTFERAARPLKEEDRLGARRLDARYHNGKRTQAETAGKS